MRKLAVALVLVIAAGVALWVNRQEVLMRVPGLIGRIVDPVGPNQPVVWQGGPAEAPEGHVILHFADGAAIRLHVECIEAEMQDLGPVWQAKSKPHHPDEGPVKA